MIFSITFSEAASDLWDDYKISAGKIEGINQKIKTLRRHGYGYPDDEYFFLKIMDMSRKVFIRNQPSHKICDWAFLFIHNHILYL